VSRVINKGGMGMNRQMAGRIAVPLALIAFVLMPFQQKTFAQGSRGQCATFDGFSGNLHIPCFRLQNSMYALDLHLTESALNLVNYDAADIEDSSYYCSKYNMADNTFRIPCIALGSDRYWADLELKSISTLSFVLKDYGAAFGLPLLYNAGITPLWGNSATLFTFYVSYYDQNGFAPVLNSIIVDGVKNPMTLMKGVASNGVYSMSTFLLPGDHSFVVLFKEGNHGKTVLLDSGGLPKVNSEMDNSPPSLFQGSLQPEHDSESSLFTFHVRYFDPDGDAPVAPQVILNNGLLLSMSLTDDVPSYGTYAAERNLSGGCYCYRFAASDGIASVMFPSFGNFHGPSVDSIDRNFSPPALQPVACNTINVDPELFNGTVTPASGDECTRFTFQVDYFDIDGSQPNVVVYIDGTSHGLGLQSGSSLNGTYALTTMLPVGSHSYYFSASDGRCGAARYPAIGNLEGPNVTLFSPAGPCPSPTPGK